MAQQDICAGTSRSRAALIINADDWGRSQEITNRTLDCILSQVVSSVSTMVFMEDSERAANLALLHNVDAGLHLNLTAPFQSSDCPPRLQEQQQRIIRFLRANRFSPAIYNPALTSAFEYVVQAQIYEYQRLYHRPPARIDGHHHMHLCANVQFQSLLPQGTIARRNFSFAPNEKHAINRLYRHWQDRQLAKRHQITDFFYSLPPMSSPGRLEKIFHQAGHTSVEVETHPVNRDEYEFLLGKDLMHMTEQVRIARSYSLA